MSVVDWRPALPVTASGVTYDRASVSRWYGPLLRPLLLFRGCALSPEADAMEAG